jgi:hypothetical protein
MFAHRSFENFTPGTNRKACLLTILYSIFINQYHRAKRRPLMESLDDMEERFHQMAQPSDPALDVTTVEGWGSRWSPEVERALRLLPEDLRAPLLLQVPGLSRRQAHPGVLAGGRSGLRARVQCRTRKRDPTRLCEGGEGVAQKGRPRCRNRSSTSRIPGSSTETGFATRNRAR